MLMSERAHYLCFLEISLILSLSLSKFDAELLLTPYLQEIRLRSGTAVQH